MGDFILSRCVRREISLTNRLTYGKLFYARNPIFWDNAKLRCKKNWSFSQRRTCGKKKFACPRFSTFTRFFCAASRVLSAEMNGQKADKNRRVCYGRLRISWLLLWRIETLLCLRDFLREKWCRVDNFWRCKNRWETFVWATKNNVNKSKKAKFY